MDSSVCVCVCTPPLAAYTVRSDAWHVTEMKSLEYNMFNWVLFFCLRNALSIFRLFCTATYKIRISLLKHISDLIMFICFLCYFSWQVFRVWPVWVMNDIMFHKAVCFLRDFAILRRPKQVVPNQK